MSSALFNTRMRVAMPTGMMSPEFQLALTQLVSAIDGTGSTQVTLVEQESFSPVSVSPSASADFSPLGFDIQSEELDPV